jgi:energy-converting hydrogenase Eha subunit C
MTVMTIRQFSRRFVFTGLLGGVSGMIVFALVCQTLDVAISWLAMPAICFLCGVIYLMAYEIIVSRC